MDDDYRVRVFRSSIIESLCLPVLAFAGGIVFTWLHNNPIERAWSVPVILLMFICYEAPWVLMVPLTGPALFCLGLYLRRSIFAYLGMGLIGVLWIYLVLWANDLRPLGGMWPM